VTTTGVGRRSRARRGEGERLRTEILDATEALLLQTNDADAVSLRAVAEAVGVTPPSIYIHFESKEDLIVEVCERGFAALADFTRHSVAGIVDPVEVLKAMGRAYVQFGIEHPEQYRVLFMVRTPELGGTRVHEAVMQVSGFSKLVDAVQACIDAGAISQGDAFFYACQLWTGVHGITSLLITKPVFPWPEQQALIEGCIDTICRGLQA
jgi:AcrR family transcriptional regulator